MGAMLPKRPRDVNLSAAVDGRAVWRRVGLEQAWIWLGLGGLALAIWLSGLDTWLAHAVYAPESRWAWWLRQYGALPGGVLAGAALVLLLWAPFWRQRPLLAKSAAVLVLTAILGAGLLNQVLVKDLAERPRPRESVLMGLPDGHLAAQFNGNSMPSGHAAMGFVLTAPFFVLWPRRRRLALAFLAGGLTAGLVVGAGRMVLGAHFASDVLVAGAISLATSSLLAGLFATGLQRVRRVRARWVTAGVLALVLATAAAFVLGNAFNLTLRRELGPDFVRAELPCVVQAAPVVGTVTPTLSVQLTGFGAPLSQLQLTEKAGVVGLERRFGVYHSLACTATLALPPTE